MTPPLPRARESGVTLVEMLVALALFALVGLASFTTLDTIVKSRNRTEGRLEAVGAADRALLLFGRDLMQAAAGTVRGDDGHVSIEALSASLIWALADGTLTRSTANDRRDAAGAMQALVPDLDTLGLRYLDSTRRWHDAWPVEAGDAGLIAVELVLVRRNGAGTIRKLVILAEAPV